MVLLKPATEILCAKCDNVRRTWWFFTKMESNPNVTPFMKLFWEQQKLYAKRNPRAIRYHPMIIRFCSFRAAKSGSAYDELQSSGILTLPSRRTLRDYNGYNRYICLTFDEINVQENLVFDKYNGDLVGFVDLGDTDLNFSTFADQSKLASFT